MAKVGNSEGAGLESGTPKNAGEESDYAGDKTGIHLTRPRTTVVDEYPERPYKEAVTVDHLAVLAEFGQEPA